MEAWPQERGRQQVPSELGLRELAHSTIKRNHQDPKQRVKVRLQFVQMTLCFPGDGDKMLSPKRRFPGSAFPASALMRAGLRQLRVGQKHVCAILSPWALAAH